jgi:hypothetical protein
MNFLMFPLENAILDSWPKTILKTATFQLKSTIHFHVTTRGTKNEANRVRWFFSATTALALVTV